MAEGEGVTFGDFDFHNSDAVLYRNLFGGGHVSTTSISRVQFPWDGQTKDGLRPAEEVTYNGNTVHATGHGPTVNEFYPPGNLVHTTSQMYSNVNYPVQSRQLSVGGVQAHDTGVPQPVMVPNTTHVDVPPYQKSASAIITNVNNYPSGLPLNTGPYDGPQKSDSLKRRKKKQRDPSYYDNYYKNQELSVGNNGNEEVGHVPVASKELEATSDSDGYLNPAQERTSMKTPLSTDSSSIKPEGAHRVVSQNYMSSSCTQSDQLDHRTTKSQSESPDPKARVNTVSSNEVEIVSSGGDNSIDSSIPVQVNTISSSQSTSSTPSSNFPASVVPPSNSYEQPYKQSPPTNQTPNLQPLRTVIHGNQPNASSDTSPTNMVHSQPPNALSDILPPTTMVQVHGHQLNAASDNQPPTAMVHGYKPTATSDIQPPSTIVQGQQLNTNSYIQQYMVHGSQINPTSGLHSANYVPTVSNDVSSLPKPESSETKTTLVQAKTSEVGDQVEMNVANKLEDPGATTLPSTSEPQTVPLKPSPWGSKPISWAGLFQKEGQNSMVVHSVSDSPKTNQPQRDEKKDVNAQSADPVTTDKDPLIKKLGVYLKTVTISNKPMFIQPRGLINIGNNCYINSILQIIVACPPFYNLFQRLPLAVKRRGPSSTPMLDAILDLCKQFEEMPFGNKKLRPGEPFEPVGVYQMLRKVNTTLSIKQGKQEDAEEFFSALLNGFHDEMIGAMGTLDGPKPAANGPQTPNGVASDHEEEDGDDEWEQVGPKKKATITRVANFTKSPIYDIFGGQMRSALHQHGARESATLQPFFTLQLDIQSAQITSVKGALESFGTKEAVHGFMSNKTKTEVEASKRTSLEELPPVLILHLKQFVYDKTGGCQKLTKKMEYEMDLEISKDLLSPSGKSKIPPGQRNFKLFAVIYHTGKEASGGHYISDYYHVGINGWIRADDNLIKTIKPVQVLNPPNGFTPYLLVYRRREVPPYSTGGSKT